MALVIKSFGIKMFPPPVCARLVTKATAPKLPLAGVGVPPALGDFATASLVSGTRPKAVLGGRP